MTAFSDVLVDPAQMSLASTGSRRFLHNRGLYIDYLEQEARDAIAEAITECPDATPDVNCILPYLPFTSVNTTDISQWDTDPSVTYITITNLGTNTPFPTGGGNQSELPRYARGIVTGYAVGNEDAKVAMQRSNTGLSDSKPIDWQDAGKDSVSPHDTIVGEVAADQQAFRVGNAGGGTCTNEPTGSYNVNLVPPASVVLGGFGVSWSNPSPVAQPGCPSPTVGGTCSAGATSNSAVCNIKYLLPQNSNLAISGFNRAYAGTSETWTCTKPNGQTITGTYAPEMCTNLRVVSVSAGAAIVNWDTPSSTTDGKPAEQVNITVNPLAPLTDVVVTFGEQTAPRKAGYQCNAGNGNNVTFQKLTCSD